VRPLVERDAGLLYGGSRARHPRTWLGRHQRPRDGRPCAQRPAPAGRFWAATLPDDIGPGALYVSDHAKIVQEVLGTDATGNQGRPMDVAVTVVTGDPRAPASGDYSTMRAPDGLAASHRAASVDV
jgi:hypothetical protein